MTILNGWLVETLLPDTRLQIRPLQVFQ